MSRVSRRTLAGWLLVSSAGLLLWAPFARAQSVSRSGARAERGSGERFTASSYLPIGHWAYPQLEYWISVGRIDNLSPFVKPYRRIDIARALLDLEDQRLYGFEKTWMERLEWEFASELEVLRGGNVDQGEINMHFESGAVYRSQSHRDLLRPELDNPKFSKDKLDEHIFLHGRGHGGHFAAAFRAGRDGIYTRDPQFPGGRVVPHLAAPALNELKIRVEEGYGELQTKYARLFFGRMYRNWGPPQQKGFLRSDYAYSEEELGYRFGTDRVFLIGSIASYQDFRGDTTHYVAMHRLEVRPIPDFMISVSEATVHGGPSQGLDFRLVNPFAIWQIARTDNDPPHNKLGQVDFWWRVTHGFTMYGSALLDSTNGTQSCCQIGGTFGLEFPVFRPGIMLRASATAIQSLAYRTSLPWEAYSVERIGIGGDKADVILGTLEIEWLASADLTLRPRLQLQAKGEGDFRQLRPPGAVLDTIARILIGDAETTIRPGIAGRWRINRGSSTIDLEWDFGLNAISDYRNVTGDNRTEFVGTLKAVVETPHIGIVLK